MALRDEIIEKMRKAGCSEERIKHSIAVTDLALKIAKEMENQGIEVDKELIEKGALLHDLGYVRSKMPLIELPEYERSGLKLPAYYDLVRHQQAGAEMIEEMGFPRTVALIALRHDAIILKNDERKRLKIDPVPEDDISVKTFEEKAVLYADMLVFLKVMGLNPWSDAALIREKFMPILKYVAENAGEEALAEVLMERVMEQLNEAKKYLKKNFFTDNFR